MNELRENESESTTMSDLDLDAGVSDDVTQLNNWLC